MWRRLSDGTIKQRLILDLMSLLFAMSPLHVDFLTFLFLKALPCWGGLGGETIRIRCLL